MKEFTVVLVVHGYVENEDANIGEIECTGFEEADGLFFVKDGRVCYDISARNSKEAYDKAFKIFENDFFGDLQECCGHLEHVSYIDESGEEQYLYENELEGDFS